MVKIIFEIEEDYVKEQADFKNYLKREVSNKAEAIKAYSNVVSFSMLQQAIDKGAKKAVVRQEELTKKNRPIYDKAIAKIAMLGAYAFLNNN